MERNLKKLLVRFYEGQGCLDALSVEVDELERQPVTYNHGTDIDHLQQVLDYKTKLYGQWHDYNLIKQEMRHLTDDIIDVLTTIDFPPDKKIPVMHDEFVTVYFWYNDDGEVHYELAV